MVEATNEFPLHFFTIVLNGEPFIRYHIEIFHQLQLPWHWHIVEGVAEQNHDSSWMRRLGGCITDELHQNGLSKDGTTAYLDELQEQYPTNISVYRKPKGIFWDGKLEMVNTPLARIRTHALLWQIDADELWTVDQIQTAYKLFLQHSEKTAAYYWCWYFVGEKLLITTRNCYAENPQQEWLRTWRYRPGMQWYSHSPPRLIEPTANGQWRDVGQVDPFSHAETEAYGLVFQHYAYVTQEQLQFKECYYGYAGAISQWKRLQQEIRLPVRLRQYFSWVGDLTMVDRPEVRGVTPIAQQSAGGCQWCFNTDGQGLSIKMPPRPLPLILIDGVFFQLYKTKFVQVWRSLLEQWVENGFSKHIILLDRGGTAPDIPGIHYYPIQPYVANDSENDRQILQQACDRLEADLFVSTYFTVPLATPSVLMLSNLNLSIDETQKNAPHPIVKRDAITYASAYITFSQNIADDLIDHFPDQVQRSSISVVHNGVSPCFKLATTQQVSVFKHRYGITKPYFLLVVDGNEKFFQNNELFFRGLDHLITKIGIDIIATTQSPNLPDQWRNYTNGSTVHLLQLTEEELAVAYCGAIALVQSTKDEGFILPMAEAMACGCPVVVSCPQSLFSEGVDYAPVLYVRDSDSEAMANALCDIQKPGIRQVLIHQGLQQTSLYTWQRMAEAIQSQLVKTTLTNLNLQSINWIFSPNWRGSEDLLYEDLAQLIDTFVHHPESNQMTLLIDNHNLMDIDLEWMLVDIAVNTLMKDDLNSDEPSINLLGKLSPIQWSTVAQFIQGWLVSPNQDDSITCANQYHIPIIMLDERTPPSFQVK